MAYKAENVYPDPMLSGVDYKNFDETFNPLVDLESGVLAECRYFR